MNPTKNQVRELQAIISKFPVHVSCVSILPEFGLQWKHVSKVVRNHRLPMEPGSIARVISRHVAKASTQDEVEYILDKLRLKLLAVQKRKWHVITLLDPLDEDISIEDKVHLLPDRVSSSIQAKSGRRPKILSAVIDSMVFLSVCVSSQSRNGTPLHVAAPPGNPVALVTSTTSSLLKHCVLGLGYQNFENAYLCGEDIPSLLAIHNRHVDANADHLMELPEYNPMPEVTDTGIDYTYKNYNTQYVNSILGPKPPILTQLDITSSKAFFDPSRLRKTMKISVQVRSDNIAQTLKNWVEKKALAPTSDLFLVFTKVKCNRFDYGDE